MAKYRDAEEIYRESLQQLTPASEPHPPKFVRVEVWPYPDLDKLWVRLETTPFIAFPNLAFTVYGPDEEVSSSMFMVEIREPYQSVTMHLRQAPRRESRTAWRSSSAARTKCWIRKQSPSIWSTATRRQHERKPQMNEPSDQELKDILTGAKRVAIVGISDNPERDSHEVGKFLSEHGFEIIPVNPTVDEVLGRRAYASVRDIPGADRRGRRIPKARGGSRGCRGRHRQGCESAVDAARDRQRGSGADG